MVFQVGRHAHQGARTAPVGESPRGFLWKTRPCGQPTSLTGVVRSYERPGVRLRTRAFRANVADGGAVPCQLAVLVLAAAAEGAGADVDDEVPDDEAPDDEVEDDEELTELLEAERLSVR